MREIYLDNAAATRAAPEVIAVMTEALQNNYANPSSLHFKGGKAFEAVGRARYEVASLLAAPTDRIFFVPGGTYANNLAVFGAAPEKTGHIVTTSIEHASVQSAAEKKKEGGMAVTFVPPGKEGTIRAQDVIDAVRENTVLVSVMAVNNETGEILPMREIVQGVREKNSRAVLHTDAIQMAGKLSLSVREYDVDVISLSAHKMHGPKGIAALYVKEGVGLTPLLVGGPQEKKYSPGTENVPAICGFGEAARLAKLSMKPAAEHAGRLKEKITAALSDLPGFFINSPQNSSPYHLNLSTCVATDKMVSSLSRRGIYVSGSSACSKGAKSRPVAQMGIAGPRLAGVIRIGLSRYSTAEEADRLIAAIRELVLEERANG